MATLESVARHDTFTSEISRRVSNVVGTTPTLYAYILGR